VLLMVSVVTRALAPGTAAHAAIMPNAIRQWIELMNLSEIPRPIAFPPRRCRLSKEARNLP
jgi:hypothetical protein